MEVEVGGLDNGADMGTVSKAALRSSNSRMLRAPESAEVRRSLMTLTRAVSVL